MFIDFSFADKVKPDELGKMEFDESVHGMQFFWQNQMPHLLVTLRLEEPPGKLKLKVLGVSSGLEEKPYLSDNIDFNEGQQAVRAVNIQGKSYLLVNAESGAINFWEKDGEVDPLGLKTQHFGCFSKSGNQLIVYDSDTEKPLRVYSYDSGQVSEKILF